MKQATYGERRSVRLSSAAFDEFQSTEGMWYESEAEVTAALCRGQRKAGLLRWVRRTMAARLTKREQVCIHLYYFEGRGYSAIAGATGTHKSSVWRAIQRGLRKLRTAKEEDRSWERFISD